MAYTDEDWELDAVRHGWSVAERTTRFWRRWGVRHIRAIFHIAEARDNFDPGNWRAYMHAEWQAYAIWRGWS